MSEPILKVQDLQVSFGATPALRGVNFDISAGETLGLVGESGSGKSTLARALLRLIRTTCGTVNWRGRDLLSCDAKTLRGARRELQIVFQDPFASLNPRMTVGKIIAEPLEIHEPRTSRRARYLRVEAMLERVGLTADMSGRYPHEFSGGQCQRIAIARAMVQNPLLLVCDEPVSSLDVSIQGQIVNLLLDMQRDTGTAMLFISHNLGVVRHLSHRVQVMYAGRIVETASCDALFENPLHPYTKTLLAAVPSLPPGTRSPASSPAPSPATLPPWAPVSSPPVAAAIAGPASDAGCAFRHRCPQALALCAAVVPPLVQVSTERAVACHAVEIGH